MHPKDFKEKVWWYSFWWPMISQQTGFRVMYWALNVEDEARGWFLRGRWRTAFRLSGRLLRFAQGRALACARRLGGAEGRLPLLPN